MNTKLVQVFYAALKLPIPSGQILERDIGFADTLIATYGPDLALANVKLVMRQLPNLNLRTPLRGLGSLVRLPWLIENASRHESAASLAKAEADERTAYDRQQNPYADAPVRSRS